MKIMTTTAPRKLRVLLLEDREIDAELILHELRQSGFDPDWRRVDTQHEFVTQLDSPIDIILADYRLPQFDGLEALRHVQQRSLDIPFLIISGTLGDELAAQCIKHGVTDYLLKDRLERLGLAVTNALEEKRLRAERKVVDEQLRQAQKMEAVGRLAAGIAHDFSNVLTIINGRVWLLLEHESFSRETTEALKQVHLAGERAANLTRQLLFFSRKREVQRQSLPLNATIDAMSDMLRRLIGEQINLELKLDPQLPAIEADASMMEQIMMNFAVNARDAMRCGGRLLITTESQEITEAQLCGKDARPGCYVCLRVQDTGCGMPPELLSRIFEPFFTTKEAGEGTGLGLATIFSIAKQHQGWIDVESTVGVGTTFKVFLPVARSMVGIVPKQELVEADVSGGSETILVVEDETNVREFAVAALQRYDYRVLQARSGVGALEVWKRHGSGIDLLLTDVVMPDEMTGPELAARLRTEKPALGVLLTSGYSHEMMSQVFGPRQVARLIQKPYHPRELAKAVREILDAKARCKPPLSSTSIYQLA